MCIEASYYRIILVNDKGVRLTMHVAWKLMDSLSTKGQCAASFPLC